MTYYLYRRDDGMPEVAEYAIPLEIYPGWQYLGESEERPDVTDKVLNMEGQLVPDLDAMKRRKAKLIERERDLRLSAPIIEYDGMRLDADPLSKQNLQDKITAVNARASSGKPPSAAMLVWRDADNVMHSFASLNAYRAWLDGFVIALEERGMQAWGWSWAKKDQLAAMTTVEEVLAFDPTT